ncbi:MAG: hypothetical protein HQ517_02370 [SAR324 cluster bacterium]|nr:hypothetical protein [SAR324 cluster bacterium]
MKTGIRYILFNLIIIALFCFSFPVFAITIQVNKLGAAPVLDGNLNEWKKIESIQIPLKNTKSNGKSNVKSITVKAGTFKDQVFFLFQWKDTTLNANHKPFIWNKSSKKYENGTEKEDRMALQFGMEGDYTADWDSGNTFKADMWHWKAARSNPAGIFQDKMTILSSKKVKKAYKMRLKNGKEIYIKRPSDKGDKLYKTKRYSKKEKDVMPKYIVTKNPRGSIGDVKVKGVWKNGMWTLEVKRKMDTGHNDDVKFVAGKSYKAGFAVFNQSVNDDHNISETLTFKF